MKSLQTVLVANRGEIAVRIMRTLRERGLRAVAVYSDADSNSRHRYYADQAVRLPGRTSAETYLNIEAILAAIKSAGADAVHPGYGFLSENAKFAQAVTDAGCTFIGPSAEAMTILGDKVQAKRLMRKHHIPVTPGSEGGLRTVAEFKALIAELGYPLIIKAAAGGGGRGMRVVTQDSEVAESFAACQREALDYFGNPEVFAERYIANPRHIEVQVICDQHGQGFHLNERDCSVQRRHQKLVEEAPSAYLSPAARSELGGIAVRAALAAGYTGVGTAEFICESPEKIYFMEMNTRIQVEHTVSEEITRVDLVAEQLKVAEGLRLTLTQEALAPQGWAIECRINAEDPLLGFAPAPGTIKELHWPQGPFVRVDTHITAGYEIPSEYDSMIAKIIVWGEDRQAAIRKMQRALSETVIVGVPTTVKFHEAVLAHPDFISGEFDTGFMEQQKASLEQMMSGGGTQIPLGAALLAQIAAQASRQPVTWSQDSAGADGDRSKGCLAQVSEAWFAAGLPQ